MTAHSAEQSNVWRPLCTIVAISVAGSIIAAGTASAGDVRPLQQRGRALLTKGMARSVTFEGLVHRIRRSNIVVHVDLHRFEQRKLDGTLAFAVSAAGTRYLRIWLRPQRIDDDVLVAFGHELQHVAEVAEAPEVVCGASFAAFWRHWPPRFPMVRQEASPSATLVIPPAPFAGRRAHFRPISRTAGSGT